MTSGTGIFFAILCFGLMTSRIIGARTLRRNMIVLNCSLGIIISLFGYFIFAAFHNYWGYYGSALIIGLGNGHMFPAMQNMFISLAASSQRGTANSTLLTSWDIGIGLGVLFGGSFVEWFGYTSAFWLAWVVNALGVSFFFAYARLHYQRNKYIPCS